MLNNLKRERERERERGKNIYALGHWASRDQAPRKWRVRTEEEEKGDEKQRHDCFTTWK